MRLLKITLVGMLLAAWQASLIADEDLFRQKVAPIFAAHCVRCHNANDPKGEFALDNGEAFSESGYAEAGNAANSHLIDVVISDDPATRPDMPKTGPVLSKSEVATLRLWIDQGAQWPTGYVVAQDQLDRFDWWSLKPIKTPGIPSFDDADAKAWIRTPIDAFILSKLRDHRLSPTVVADRRTLIRRLYYDLTGLPPSYEQVIEFENDPAENAYERLVDQLLDSPRYGERWARHWLDVVKYADTCGYDKDKLRPNAWPYRDYVIRSLNSDKPYARFVQEQVAGDALYPGQPDGILGLGFIAAGPWDFIGHVEVPETKTDGKVARNLDRDDMVSNMFNTFCSATIQCARCHDHKFDPFTQQHYYGLQAVFAAVDRADRVYDDDPAVASQRIALEQRVEKLEGELADVEASIANAGGEELVDLDRQLRQIAQSVKRPEFGFHSQIAATADEEKWVELEFAEPRSFSQIILRPCHDDFAGIGAGFGFPARFRVEIDNRVIFDRTDVNFPNPALQPVTIPANVNGTRIRVVATRLAERKQDFIFALAELEVVDSEGQSIAPAATVHALDSIEAPSRWRKSNLNDNIWYDNASSSERIQALKQQRQILLQSAIGQSVIDKQQSLKAGLKSATAEIAGLPTGKLVYAAATKFPPQGNFHPTNGAPREIRWLHRGDVQSPRDVAVASVLPLNANDPHILQLNNSADESERRAELAKWLTSRNHPLTWRSIVNRVWHHHFGSGIVKTPNDFGRMGAVPTHPELLDWLAAEFRDRGGSLKQLHRMIVNSSVYRQSSSSSLITGSNSGLNSPTASELDPLKVDAENRLLWRMNRRRLSAEEIRDSVLLSSGRLNLKMGGPGYYLFDLEKTEHSPHYEYHEFDHNDENSYRRSIYRFIVRSQPNPYMTTLDCADSSQSTPARTETQTPLQSLTMLNSSFHLTMARRFESQILEETKSVDRQVEIAIQRSLGRSPTSEERKLMTGYVRKHGLANLCRILFNMSEFVYVD